MTSNPFTYGSMITNPERFIGRRAELQQIVARLNGGQTQGSSVVGQRRIGKSSLLHYLAVPRANETIRPNNQLKPIYLSAASGDCETPAQFRVTLFKAILAAQPPADQPLLAIQTQLATATDFSWADGRTVLNQLPKNPVVCLDEFEAWLGEEKKSIFDDRFFNALRSWANEGLLAWITASKLPLQDYAKEHSYDSPFFNILATVRLGAFSEHEVQLLLMLAQSTVQPFAPKERRWVQQWAGGSPYHLQMVAYELWEQKAVGEVNQAKLKAFLCQQSVKPPICRQRNEWLQREHVAWLCVFLLLLLLYAWVPAIQKGMTIAWGGIKSVWRWFGDFGDGLGGFLYILIIGGIVATGLWQRQRLGDIGRKLWEKLSP